MSVTKPVFSAIVVIGRLQRLKEKSLPTLASYAWQVALDSIVGTSGKARPPARRGIRGGDCGSYSAFTTDTNMLPPDLQAAMRARDEAFYAVDAAQWGKYTASDFTTVQQNGQFMSRAERIGNLQTQKQRPCVPREREQHQQQGDLVVTRFFSGGLWVVEVWKRIDGAWATVMTQATTATSTTP